MPEYAHVPGQTPRHPAGRFDAICATAGTAGDADGLSQSDAWRAGLVWLDAGYFWEAHEALEAVWAALPRNSAERRLAQALIQIANAGLKARMGRPRAVARLLVLAGRLIDECGAGGRREIMGQSLDKLRKKVAAMDAAQT